MVYHLCFYDTEKKSRNNKWMQCIFAENDEEAIEQAELTRKSGDYYYCKLYKTIYNEKLIKKWEK